MRCYNCANWEKSSYMDATCYNMPRCLMNDVNRRIKYNEFKYEVGKKILFKGDKRYYTIIACDERFLICLRKANKNTYYTICDLYECIRGADNYNGYYDYANKCTMDLTLALYRLNMKQDSEYIQDSKLPEDIKQELIEGAQIFDKSKNPSIDKLEISYRNWVPLEIEDVK